jgi:type IV pilus assembly protein PilQ
MKLKEQSIKKTLLFSAAMIVFYLFSACTGTEKSERKDPFFDKWQAKAESSRGYSPSAGKRAVDQPELQEKRIESSSTKAEKTRPGKPLPKQHISLKMYNTDVAVVLRTLARAVNQNIIINENVKGLVNINVDAPWNEAFHSILRSQGLTFAWHGEIINIVSTEDKINDLKQLDVEQQIQSKKREMEIVEPLITRVVRVNFADAEGLRANLEKFLTEKAEGKALGSVMVDKHTNALIIQAIDNDMKNITRLIEELDRPISQILIEAHIVETTSDTARELGVQWGGLYHGTSGGDNYWITPGVAQGGPVQGSPLGAGYGVGVEQSSGGTVAPSSGYAVNFPAALTDGMGLSIGYVAEEVGKNILAVQLSALQKDGRLNILSSPSITTLDNQEAIIESGKEVPFQTVSDGDVKIEFKKAVLSLKVTPHVINGDTLKLSINTHKDEIDFSNQVQGNPTIITKAAQTTVMLYDGQTTVIGGLNKETTSQSEAGVPWLKNIPILGYLFKARSKSNTMEEVLIFITPHILKERPGTEIITK